jgi:hypothetical protein
LRMAYPIENEMLSEISDKPKDFYAI